MIAILMISAKFATLGLLKIKGFLHQCGRRVKTKSQKDLGANSYDWQGRGVAPDPQ